MGLRLQPRSKKFFTLISKAGPNVVESCIDRRSRALRGCQAPPERYSPNTRHCGVG
jgi:hypothetical protein